MKTLPHLPWQTWLCLVTACVALPTLALAQSDNFDNGDISAWQVLSTDTQGISFPTVGAGKGLGVKMSGDSYAYFIRTNSYSDFYVAVDVVNWAQLNQDLGLLARAHNIAGQQAVGTQRKGIRPNANNISVPGGTFPGSGMGYNCTFDVLEHFPFAGGQFRINRIDGSTMTVIADDKITLVPGRPYRLVFQGTGSLLTAQIYDSYDLTHPLDTISATDTRYTNGVCGMLSYEGTSATTINGTDVTFDNYYAGASDPNTALAPAIPASVPGTPQVISRTPASRRTNFYSPTNGLTFALTTYGGGTVDAGATKLYLNDVDVSAALTLLPSPVNTPTYFLPAGSLKSNTVYSARIEAANTGGNLKSTNTFWFDTFSQAYLSTPPVKTVEAEDYNYGSGRFQPDPIPVSGYDTNHMRVNGNLVGYFNLSGTAGVDFDHTTSSGPDSPWNEYRDVDPVATMQGEIEDKQFAPPPPDRHNDTLRAQYAKLGVLEYEVARTKPGEWLNYTRLFEDGDYNVYLRVGSCSGPTKAYLDQVTSDPTRPNQSTNLLGTFEIPNLFTRWFYRYIPLTSNGQLVSVQLSGQTTLRLTIGGPSTDLEILAINYILFVPAVAAPGSAVTLESSASMSGTYAAVSGATINTNARTITIPVSGPSRFYRLRAATALRIKSITVSQGIVTIQY